MNCTLDQLLPLVKGITKKEIAIALDKKSPLFSYSVEFGATSYHNYTRDELLRHCIQFDVDVVSEYTKMGRKISWQKEYAEVTGTEFKNYNAIHYQGNNNY